MSAELDADSGSVFLREVDGVATRFLSSLDAALFTRIPAVGDLAPKGAELQTRELHAEVESMLSLLMGERLHFTKIMPFNSYGAQKIAYKILRAREGKFVGDSPTRNPIALGIWPPSDRPLQFQIADLFEKAEPRHTRFVTTWQEIDEDPVTRREIARLLRLSDFAGMRRLVSSHDDWGQLYDRVEMLEYLVRYFDGVDATEVRDRARLSLDKYCEWLIALEDEDLFQLVEADMPFAKDIKDALSAAQHANVNLQRQAELFPWVVEHADRDHASGAIVFHNACYQDVVADSLKADTVCLTSLLPMRNDHVRVAERLARNAIDMASKNRTDRIEGGSWPIARVAVDIRSDLLRLLNPVSWNRVWEIMVDERWRLSVRNLDRELAFSDRGGDELYCAAEEALFRHVELVSSMLARTDLKIEAKNNRLIELLMMTVGTAAGTSAGIAAENVLGYWFELPHLLPKGTIGAAAGGVASVVAGWKLGDIKAWRKTGAIKSELWPAVRVSV